MSESARSKPVEQFLGPAAAAGGPFALLALSPEDCTQELIIVQLQRQLRRVESHAEARTHGADEVRLALHAAAAQLLEAVGTGPSRPEGEIGAAVHSGPAESAGGGAGAPSFSAGMSPGQIEMEQAIVATLAQFGGWNAECLHRLSLIAHARGVSQEEFLAAIDAFRHVPTGGAVAARAATATSRGLGSGRTPGPAQNSARGAGDAKAEGVAASGAGQRETPGNIPSQAVVEAAALEPMTDSRLGREEADQTPKALLALAVVIVAVLAFLGGSIYVVARLTAPGATTPLAGGDGADGPAEMEGRETRAPDGNSPGKSVPPVQRFPTLSKGPDPATGSSHQEALPASTTPSPSMDVGMVLRELQESSREVRLDAAKGGERFLRALEAASETWTSARADELDALQDAVVEFMYRSGTRTAEGRAGLDAVIDGVRALPVEGLTARDVRRGVFSAGMVARLSRERELPGEVVDEISRVMRTGFFRTLSVGDASFRGGATSACVEIGKRLTPKPGSEGSSPDGSLGAWEAWIACVRAALDTPRNAERLMLQGLEGLLLDAPEPTQSKATFDAIAVLAGGFAWTSGEETRGRLLRWFDQPEVSSIDLHAVTSAVATKGLAAGVDSSMVLSPGAGDAARAELRDRYREAWGESGDSRRLGGARPLLDAARAALDRQPATDLAGRFSDAVWFSRMTEVAGALWYGKAAPAIPESSGVAAASGAPAFAFPAAPGTGVFTFSDPASDSGGLWVVQYQAVRQRIPERRELLRAYAPGGGMLTFVEAPVIVSEAVRGSPFEVRRDAADVVRAHASEPAFVLALLAESATMPLTRANARLVGDVAQAGMISVRQVSFRVHARRVLVERALELMSGAGDLSSVDSAGVLLAESYAARAALAGSVLGRDAVAAQGGSAAEDVTNSGAESTNTASADQEDAQIVSAGPANFVPLVETSAQRVRLALEDEARRQLPSGREIVPLAEIRQLRTARARAARGRLQILAAEQASCVDLLAYLVVTESPAQAGNVAKLLKTWEAQRQGAGHVAEQIVAAERAMLELWLLRLQGEGA